ncbi:hypothetical protein BDP27DRAFT_1365785 [Rhodocollybia butyracea]|uniref:DUF6589 domain-containing protein n=1 Tax=Rhodocollybia butyracea TaxID=206335 RepID=A0A9P5PQG1_9AGAR|nr:hypothetical protein BDP27DRAFT_1365785 [Rhodocollybia butyracea]
MADSEKIMFSNSLWEDVWQAKFASELGPSPQKIPYWKKLHLLFSLMVFLNLSIANFINFLFTSSASSVRQKAGKYLEYHPHGVDETHRFAPAKLWSLWHENSKARPYLHTIVQGCASEIVLDESDSIISDPSLKVRVKGLTASSIHSLLAPRILYEKYCGLAPFTTGILRTFTASPNRYRRRKHTEDTDSDSDVEMEDIPLPEETLDLGETFMAPEEGKTEVPMMNTSEAAITIVIAMLSFLRNRANNLLPLLLGLFFMINGTSTRVMTMLHEVGLSVSTYTVERLKEQLTLSATEFAIELIASPHLWYIIYDNINIYLRKWDQRLTNKNEMLHATNSAVVGIDAEGIDPLKALDLGEKLEMRGQRKNANFHEDIIPTKDDFEFIFQKSFPWLITDLLFRHSPDNEKWKDRRKMKDTIEAMMPMDRPLPAKKTDTRPFGVFDVNEGSKKGQVMLNEAMQARSRQSTESWTKRLTIRVGDWLTSNLIRLARRDRTNEEDHMERLDFIEELSALWHYALQATHMIMRIHHGHEPASDPASLGAHKNSLKRVWDTNKPNYAAAKSLIRHSLIARLLHLIMVQKNWETWEELCKWRPDLDELTRMASDILKEWGTTPAAELQKQAKDDWNARSSYFIRDALFFMEFESAVRHADPGRQHNYARECVEVLVRFKYETPAELQKVLERAWFVSNGEPGRSIPSDLYLERNNFWVKRIFIAHGNGVTMEYIIKKGSACVEACRDVSHMVAAYFGNPDRSRKHKEAKFLEDTRALVEEMQRIGLHCVTKERFVPAKPRANAKNPKLQSAVIDAQVRGLEIWADGNFSHYIRVTTYDARTSSYPLGNPAKPPAAKKDTNINGGDEEEDENIDERDRGTCLDNGTIFDNVEENVLDYGNLIDLEGDDGLGGGDEVSSGEIII